MGERTGCRVFTHRSHTLGNVLGKIPDPLQIRGHADGADDGAQVLRHGLTSGDQHDGAFIKFALPGVHQNVIGDDTLRERIVGGKQGPGRCLCHRGGKSAHITDETVKMRQFLIKGGNNVLAHGSVLLIRLCQPKRPVM